MKRRTQRATDRLARLEQDRPPEHLEPDGPDMATILAAADVTEAEELALWAWSTGLANGWTGNESADDGVMADAAGCVFVVEKRGRAILAGEPIPERYPLPVSRVATWREAHSRTG